MDIENDICQCVRKIDPGAAEAFECCAGSVIWQSLQVGNLVRKVDLKKAVLLLQLDFVASTLIDTARFVMVSKGCVSFCLRARSGHSVPSEKR